MSDGERCEGPANHRDRALNIPPKVNVFRGAPKGAGGPSPWDLKKTLEFEGFIRQITWFATWKNVF